MEFYTLEKKRLFSGDHKEEFRFKSAYNECTGRWRDHPSLAIADGENHKKVVCFLFDRIEIGD